RCYRDWSSDVCSSDLMAGLVLLGFTITFSAVDWAMSLDPHWYSTVYGIIFMVGQALSAMALVIVLLVGFRDESPFTQVVRPQVGIGRASCRGRGEVVE